ncbi:hypothetical protein EDB81DRAFT_764017 [Dactylonectria macrodidyma]|uniref:Prion-inhibition and propagation HeLo domain-containing protein n=1 Tax=Dactylonectria macrodidyma TaxID=307937 RepID=A0A9P9E2Q9_9HYPO|nr:hypothetical protein EDB81DRAFT_764017 [Dactylonectria macrodidyma]
MGHDVAELDLNFREELTKTSVFAQAYNLLIDDNMPPPISMPSMWTVAVIERFAALKTHLEQAEGIVNRYTGITIPEETADLNSRAHAAAFDLRRRPTDSLVVINEANQARQRIQILQQGADFRVKLEWSMKHKSRLEEAVQHLRDDNAALLGLTMHSMLNAMYDAVLSQLPLKQMQLRSRGAGDTAFDAEAQAYEGRKGEQAQAQMFIEALDKETVQQKKARMLDIAQFPALASAGIELPDNRTRTTTDYVNPSGKKESVVVEWKECENSGHGQTRLTEDQLISRVSDVVAILNSPPTCLTHVLPSVGFFRDNRLNNRGSSWIGIAYRTSSVTYTGKYRTLRDLLIPPHSRSQKESGSYGKPPLGERFRLAQNLAQSVLQIHNCGWLHKGLRPENIAFFAHQNSVANPYLLGWESSRSGQEEQLTEAVNAWVDDAKLYRHPDWFKEPETSTYKYRAEFDQYQLGCVLLEIGRWVLIGEKGLRGATSRKFTDDEEGRDRWRQYLVDKASSLATEMGEIYCNVVKNLLLGLNSEACPI